MARKVYISSDMSVDEAVHAVARKSVKAALMWPWFLTILDDWGRTDANSHKLKSRMFPDWPGVSRSDIEKALELYAAEGLITLYVVGEDHCAAVDENNWREYQTHIRWDRKGGAASKVPAYEAIPDVPGCSRIIPPSPSPSPSKQHMSGTPDARLVFDYWQERLNHPGAAFSPERKRRIEARLKDGLTVERLREAIDGCASSAYHMGENDSGTVYDSIELIFRNVEKVETFAAMLSKPKPGEKPPDLRARVERKARAHAHLDSGLEEDAARAFCFPDEWAEVMAERQAS